MKKEKIPNFFLFYIHKLYYFVSVILAVGIRSYILITVAYVKFNTTGKK